MLCFVFCCQVQQALNAVMENYTVLVIAHRLSTVQRANTIVVLDDGVVAEQGNHDELMDLHGLYYKLIQRQMLGSDSTTEPPRPFLELPQHREEDDDESSGDENVPRYWRVYSSLALDMICAGIKPTSIL